MNGASFHALVYRRLLPPLQSPSRTSQGAMQAEHSSGQGFPDDILLSLAEYLFDLMYVPADFRRYLSVHPAFLFVGLSHLYETTYLDCSDWSIKMLQRIS
jgi:hypothetical protein